MNVLMVTERYFPIWGGAENQLRQLIPHLEKRGCRIKVITRRWHKDFSKSEVIDQTAVIRLGIPGSGRIATACFIAHLIIYILLNGKKVKILHSHGAVKMGALCAVLAKVIRIKNVAKIASADRVPRLANKLTGRITLSLFKKSSAIISMTDEIDAELAEIHTPRNIIYRITNGVDCNRFKPLNRKKKVEWRLNKGMKEDTPVILFSSRLVPGKGLDILLGAWPEVSEKYPEAYLVIVGSGKDQPDSVEAELKQWVSTRQFRQVIFEGETEKPEYYLGVADIFVFPSRREGFPNALMEALASGLAVVASSIGGVKAVLKKSDIGMTFKEGDSNDLTKNLLSLLGDKALIEIMGEKARIFMNDEYSFKSIAKQYAQLYSQL